MNFYPIRLMCCILSKGDEYITDYWIHRNDVAHGSIMRAYRVSPGLANPISWFSPLPVLSSPHSNAFIILSSLALQSIPWRLQETPTIFSKRDTCSKNQKLHLLVPFRTQLIHSKITRILTSLPLAMNLLSLLD